MDSCARWSFLTLAPGTWQQLRLVFVCKPFVILSINVLLQGEFFFCSISSPCPGDQVVEGVRKGKSLYTENKQVQPVYGRNKEAVMLQCRLKTGGGVAECIRVVAAERRLKEFQVPVFPGQRQPGSPEIAACGKRG